MHVGPDPRAKIRVRLAVLAVPYPRARRGAVDVTFPADAASDDHLVVARPWRLKPFFQGVQAPGEGSGHLSRRAPLQALQARREVRQFGGLAPGFQHRGDGLSFLRGNLAFGDALDHARLRLDKIGGGFKYWQ